MLRATRHIFRKLVRWKAPQILVALLLATLAYLLVISLQSQRYLERLELLGYDWMLTHAAQRTPIDDRITLIWITDADQRRWNWPIPDAKLLELLQILQQQDARTIGLDIYRDLPVPAVGNLAYAQLNEFFHQHQNIFGIQKIRDERGAKVDAPPALAAQGQVGFNDVTFDFGGLVVRRGMLFMSDDGITHTSFALKLVIHYMAQQAIYLHNHPDTGLLQFDQRPLPPALTPNYGGYHDMDSGGYQFLMSYPGAPADFQSVTLTDVLTGEFDPSLIRDKLVIIGTWADATPDFFYSPVLDDRLAGAAVHAYMVAQFLRLADGGRAHWQAGSLAQEKLWIAIWCVAGALLCLWLHTVWRFMLGISMGLGLLTLLVFSAFMQGWWLLLAAPALGWSLAMILVLAYRTYLERYERRMLMRLFSRHVSQEVAHLLWHAREQYFTQGKLPPQRLTATVLFTDLQGFTTISENMEPQALLDWLNEYMESMVQVIETHQGQVNKFIGDAIMALFGVSKLRRETADIQADANNAIACALAMKTEMDRLQAAWQQRNLPSVKMRVGIYTGTLVAGTLGGIQRQEYTVIGDTVNTAARLESFDKSLDADSSCRILIGDSTFNCLDTQRFQAEYVGEYRLKGKREVLRIYQVTGYVQDSES